ncbi:hypothetical protein QN277_017049 [Acacia crassicarpa]|uniref:Retrotransposon Copia-like N-terminal domain-containing protein n=1 Tax=Acacia crassicarpa TaxID=499986 RepID=A0AAE1JSP8_9FABA|nr:hypothetical protein QN277_017049 [Acacia crassicarpa]
MATSSTENSTGVASSTLINSLQDISNPFYLHPNENPALILVSPILTGSNYNSWARAMKMALMSKNKLQFVDRSIPVPQPSDLTYQAWQRCNMMVISWLTRSISPSLAQSILWLDRASDVWDDLQARFSQNDAFRLADLQEDIQNLRQGDLCVNDYFTKLKILWDEFLIYRPIISCSCSPKCSCGVLDLYKKHLEQDYVIRFLKGLSDRFSSVKSQIMLIDPLPTINRVFALVQQQERELGFPIANATTLLSKSNTQRYSGSGLPKPNSLVSNKQCAYCGKYKHTEATCYRKHGFPPGFKFRNASVNAVSSENTISSYTTEPVRVANSSYGFTPEQFQKLLALVKTDDSSVQPSVSQPSVSVNNVSTNEIPMPHQTPSFREDDWFS